MIQLNKIQHITNTLQTAKYMLQWTTEIRLYFSLQITANSSCSELFFGQVLGGVFTPVEIVSIPLFIRVSKTLLVAVKFTAIWSLQTATAILHFYLFRKAQLHTAITPTTPFRGVGVVAVQCCAVSVSFFHSQQISAR